MKNAFNGLLIFTFTLPFFASPAYGGSSCKTIYGGGEVCPSDAPFEVNKLVRLPSSGEYVENMTESTPVKYKASQLATFKIILKNTTNTSIPSLDVTDTLPAIVEFYAGPGVVARNSQNRQTITFVIRDLKAGQSAEYFITTRALDMQDCQKNSVVAVAQKKEQLDEAQICIEKGQVLGTQASKGGLVTTPAPSVMPPTKAGNTPPTGPEAFGLFALIPTGVAGYFLRKHKL